MVILLHSRALPIDFDLSLIDHCLLFPNASISSIVADYAISEVASLYTRGIKVFSNRPNMRGLDNSKRLCVGLIENDNKYREGSNQEGVCKADYEVNRAVYSNERFQVSMLYYNMETVLKVINDAFNQVENVLRQTEMSEVIIENRKVCLWTTVLVQDKTIIQKTNVSQLHSLLEAKNSLLKVNDNHHYLYPKEERVLSYEHSELKELFKAREKIRALEESEDFIGFSEVAPRRVKKSEANYEKRQFYQDLMTGRTQSDDNCQVYKLQ